MELKGHFENVNCVINHPKIDEILSSSSDHQIFLWVPKIFNNNLFNDDDNSKLDFDEWYLIL
jgi:hypothetical protein